MSEINLHNPFLKTYFQLINFQKYIVIKLAKKYVPSRKYLNLQIGSWWVFTSILATWCLLRVPPKTNFSALMTFSFIVLAVEPELVSPQASKILLSLSSLGSCCCSWLVSSSFSSLSLDSLAVICFFKLEFLARLLSLRTVQCVLLTSWSEESLDDVFKACGFMNAFNIYLALIHFSRVSLSQSGVALLAIISATYMNT